LFLFSYFLLFSVSVLNFAVVVFFRAVVL